MWIGDFVRCHTVIRLLNQQFPGRPVDVLANRRQCCRWSTTCRACARASWSNCRASSWPSASTARSPSACRQEDYGQALVMPRTWKSALAPFLAGISAGGRGSSARPVSGSSTTCAGASGPCRAWSTAAPCLALPRGQSPPPEWPHPQLVVPAAEVAAWRQRTGTAADGRPAVALAPGAVGPSKRWPAPPMPTSPGAWRPQGVQVWVLGGPDEKALAAEIAGPATRTCARLHRPGSAQRHPGAGRRQRRGIERFRPPACRRRHRHARHRDLRPDQPLALGAAQSARRHRRDRTANCRAGPATSPHAGWAITCACGMCRSIACSRLTLKALARHAGRLDPVMSRDRSRPPHRPRWKFCLCRRRQRSAPAPSDG